MGDIKIDNGTKTKALQSMLSLAENERIYSRPERAAKIRNAIIVVREIIKDYDKNEN